MSVYYTEGAIYSYSRGKAKAFDDIKPIGVAPIYEYIATNEENLQLSKQEIADKIDICLAPFPQMQYFGGWTGKGVYRTVKFTVPIKIDIKVKYDLCKDNYLVIEHKSPYLYTPVRRRIIYCTDYDIVMKEYQGNWWDNIPDKDMSHDISCFSDSQINECLDLDELFPLIYNEWGNYKDHSIYKLDDEHRLDVHWNDEIPDFEIVSRPVNGWGEREGYYETGKYL